MSTTHTISRRIAVYAMAFLLAGCATFGGEEMPPITTVESVDIDRFMGRWYVIANIPTFVEKAAWNATEDYVRRDADTIDTTFSYNKGGFDGPRKTYTPVATVRDDPSNAIWGMQFIWPIKADYRIVWLNDDYSVTVIGRNARDYVWVMAREPEIEPQLLKRIEAFLRDEGYDLTKLRIVPQNWTREFAN